MHRLVLNKSISVHLHLWCESVFLTGFLSEVKVSTLPDTPQPREEKECPPKFLDLNSGGGVISLLKLFSCLCQIFIKLFICQTPKEMWEIQNEWDLASSFCSRGAETPAQVAMNGKFGKVPRARDGPWDTRPGWGSQAGLTFNCLVIRHINVGMGFCFPLLYPQRLEKRLWAHNRCSLNIC